MCLAQGETPGKAMAAPAMPAAAPLETKIFPLSEVKAGLRGVAYTVFEGVTPEPMEVDILGVLKEALGPGQDMILARLRGEKPEYTGVVAGMSGSPVYVGGRLVGAISYRIGQFSKEPIAGITPIEQMLEVRDGQRLALPGGEGQKVRAGGGSPEIQAMETPLVFGGFSQETVDLFGDRFRAMGLTPVAGLGGAADGRVKQPEALVPGSAVSAILVRGDMSMAGTCTVTYVDKTQLMACGHPLTQYGAVAFPMTKATVVATLASPLNAFKIVNTTETVGAFTEDRASAILGRFGEQARMIPVVVEVGEAAPVQAEGVVGTHVSDARRGAPGDEAQSSTHVSDARRGAPGVGVGAAGRDFHYEVLDNRQLTPSAMLVTVYQSLQGTNRSAAEMSYRVRGEMTLAGRGGGALPAVRLEGVMAPSDFNPAAINTALYVNERFGRVYENALEQPVITGMRLKVEAIAGRQTAVLEQARLSRVEARPGETVVVEATIQPYQAEARVVRLEVKLPESLAPGPVRLVVGDGATLDRLTMPSGAAAQHPAGLADTVAEMNRVHANDRVYAALLSHEAQAVVESGALGGLPLSMANVLEPLKESAKAQMNGESVVGEESAEVGYALSGSAVLTLTVR